MTKNSSRRSFDLAFVSLLLFGCAACAKGDPPAGSAAPQPKEAIPESAIILPEYYGVYALEAGKTVALTQAVFSKETIAMASPKSEFILFDRKIALGLEVPKILVCSALDSEHDGQIVEFRTKPVTGRPEMLRIVPVNDLPIGRCGLLNEKNDEILFWVEIGDQKPKAEQMEEAKKQKAINNLRALWTSCEGYAQRNGRFPPSLEKLLITGDIGEPLLISPNDTDPKSKKSYIYVAGQTGHDGRNVLIYERPEISILKFPNVLFADGRVEYLDPQALKSALSETKQRLGKRP